MKHLAKRTTFLSTIVLAMLTGLALTACKPETAQSPLAIPEVVATQVPDLTRQRPIPPPGTPRPTPTRLPDRGVRAEVAQEVTTQANTSSLLGERFRFFGPATDGKTVVGTIRQDNKDVVVAVDLASGKAQILSDKQDQINEPRVSGRYVVWTAAYQLYVYDLEEAQLKQLSFGATIRQARISGHIAVFWEQISGSQGTRAEIHGYDLLAGKDFLINAQPQARAPEISSDWIVYKAGVEQPSYAGLWAVNIKTQEDIHLGRVFIDTLDSPYVPLYAIDAPWVAWSRGGQSPSPALYLYNLDTRTAYTVTIPSWGESLSEPSPITINPIYLTMSNRVVIFSGYYQDLGYDIERQVFFSLPTNAPYGFDKLGWSITGDQLVWVLSSGPYGQEESHLYTAKIIRDK